MKKFGQWIAVMLVLVLSLTACGAKEETSSDAAASAAPAVSQEPITLKIYQRLTLTDTEYKTLIEEPVKKKFPNITLVKIDSTKVALEDLIANGEVPDIIYGNISSYFEFEKLGIIQLLDDYIKKYKFDTGRIKPVILESIKGFTKEGSIYALPFNLNLPILYYNKDIFDKFAVPYPPDEQLTWEQAIELGRKLTKTDNGVNYVGIDVENGPIQVRQSLSLPFVDINTGKASVNTPEWKKVFDVYRQSFDVPGYIQGDKYVYDRDSFLKAQNLAMRPAPLANMVGYLEDYRKQGKELNWDIAPIPTFKEQLGNGPEVSVHTLYITKQGKHKDEAFQVFAHILSDEVQRILARNGRVPSIVNPELEKEYGADIPALKGKKIENIFKAKPLPIHKTHKYETEVSGLLADSVKDLALQNEDSNTSLRKLEEKINIKLQQLENADK